MNRTSPRPWIWLPLATAAALLLAVVWGPIAVGFECWRLHASAARAEAHVVEADVADLLVLTIATGPRAGEHCTADTSEAHRAELEPGDALDVVLPADRPDECVLVATLDNSILLLWSLVGMVAVALLLLVLIGTFLERSFGRAAEPSTRFDSGAVVCPRCGAAMREGYLPLLAPIHWRDPGDPIGLPTVFTGLPGTVGWRGRARVAAFRCAPCGIVTLRHASGGEPSPSG